MWQRIKNIYHFFVAIAANLLFLFPGRKLTVIGVTGTDGKTTTSNLIYHILVHSGKKAALVSTLGANIGDSIVPIGFHVTTPASVQLQKLLNWANKMHSQYFVLEVTSHSLDQNRVWGIPFEIGVLTNITSEHLDYHKTYENYVKAKEKLLKMAKIAVVNRDDGSYPLLVDSKNKKTDQNWVTYGLSESSDVNPQNFNLDKVSLIGDFNKYNVLAAVAACRKLGISEKDITDAVKVFKLPVGRLDIVYKGDFAVMIDFAHTPNAFEQLLKSLRPLVKGRIIHVYGSAGERDAQKRPYLGEISSSFADIEILTSEDPRKEEAADIIEEIASGIDRHGTQAIKIPDRKQAITAAIEMAKKNDLVLLTGKSTEASMNMGSGEEPWDEYKVVDNILKSLELIK